MANEQITYDDFADRAGPICPPAFDRLPDEAKERVLAVAWEECAWIATLTDERIVRALTAALVNWED